MKKIKIDLHMHSNISNDGDFFPSELMKMCKEAGLETVALADHNSVRGVAEAVNEGKKLGIRVVPGVELDCIHKEYNLHLLGYNIDYSDKIFSEIEKNVFEQELEAGDKRMALVKKAGIFFDEEKVKALSPDGTITGEMIGEIAIADERNKNNSLVTPYMKEGTRSENPYVNFYWDWCSKGKPAYVPVKYITLKEAVNIIHKAGGKTVLAHPNNNIGMNENIFKEIIAEGVDGVEVFSSYHSDEVREFFLKMAEKYNLAVTCGSDFHGKIKPAIKLGEIDCCGREKEIADFV